MKIKIHVPATTTFMTKKNIQKLLALLLLTSKKKYLLENYF